MTKVNKNIDFLVDTAGNLIGSRNPRSATSTDPLFADRLFATGGSSSLPIPLTNTGPISEFRAQTDVIDTAALDVSSGDFRITGHGSGSAFADWNAANIFDKIYSVGVNPGYADSSFRERANIPSLSLTWETKYWIPGGRKIYAQEFGLRGFTTANVERRVWDSYLPYDGMGYQFAFNVHQFALAHPISRTGVIEGYQRILHDFWPRNTIDYKGIPLIGTAAGAITNAAGYPIDTEQVTLAAAGSGNLPLNCVFRFNGVGPYYAVQEAVDNVAAGGLLKFFPPLSAALPAAAQSIVRTALPAPVISYATNNTPMVQQQNAAGNGFLGQWYYDQTDGLTLPLGLHMTSNAVGAPLIMRGKTGQTGAIVAFQDADGTVLGGPGGVSNNTSGDGRGWHLVIAKDESSGYEARGTASGRTTNLYMGVYPGFNSSAEIRADFAGTNAANGSLDFTLQNTTTNLFRWIQRGGPVRAQMSGTLMTFQVPVKLPSFANVAALPSAVTLGVGTLLHVAATTTPGGPCILVSDGAVWKVQLALSGATTVA